MDRLIELFLLAAKTYTKVKRKVRRKDVKENPIDNFADKFGDPERVRDSERVRQRSAETELDSGTKRRGDSR